MVGVLDFLTKHFWVLSTAITSLLAAVTYFFIYSYLSVFDYSLIFIVESTDVLKFTFIAFSIAAGLSGLIYSFILNFHLYIVERTMNKWVIAVLLFSFVALSGFNIWQYQFVHYVQGRWLYEGHRLSSQFFIIYWLFSIRKNVINWPNLPKLGIFADISIFFISIYIWGATYGLSVKFSEQNHSDVLIKDSQMLHDATIVMLLSHHSIFLVGQTIVTMPSANVTRIVHAIP